VELIFGGEMVFTDKSAASRKMKGISSRVSRQNTIYPPDAEDSGRVSSM
jgi:hypothetical protein